MIGDAAWQAYTEARTGVEVAMLWASYCGGGGLLAAKLKSPGRTAMADARFGLAVFRNEPPLYPVEER